MGVKQAYIWSQSKIQDVGRIFHQSLEISGAIGEEQRYYEFDSKETLSIPSTPNKFLTVIQLKR